MYVVLKWHQIKRERKRKIREREWDRQRRDRFALTSTVLCLRNQYFLYLVASVLECFHLKKNRNVFPFLKDFLFSFSTHTWLDSKYSVWNMYVCNTDSLIIELSRLLPLFSVLQSANFHPAAIRKYMSNFTLQSY